MSKDIQCWQLFEVDGQDAARAAVATGIGGGIISVPELGTDSRLTPLQLKDCHLEMDEVVACVEERPHLRIIESFLELARSSVREKRAERNSLLNATVPPALRRSVNIVAVFGSRPLPVCHCRLSPVRSEGRQS